MTLFQRWFTVCTLGMFSAVANGQTLQAPVAPLAQPHNGSDAAVKAEEPAAQPALPADAAAAPSTPLGGSLGVSFDKAAEWTGYIRPRLSLRHDFGDSVGYRNGFTYLEAFIPFRQKPGDWVTFANVRSVNFDDADLWEFNVGVGARRYNAQRDRIIGAYVQYDLRTTQAHNSFNQINVGVESLGRFIDVRANVYRIVGTDRFVLADVASDPSFRGFTVLFNRTTLSEVGLNGVDAEIGTPVPLVPWDVRAFVGYYHYHNDGAASIDGVRGRVEANLSERVTLHFAIQHDQVFHTTVNGGIALHFGPGRSTRGGVGRGVVDRLGDRIVRDPNIMARAQTDVTKLTATDTAGAPIVVKHVNSASAAGGDGSAERPYQTLAQLQAGATPGNILFAHANSVFTGQAITLQANQRFLGEGIAHTLTTQQGIFVLPRVTAGTTLPSIAGAAGNAVTVGGNNIEVAGFGITNPGLNGIFGDGVISFNINRNTVTGAANVANGGNGIWLKNLNGSGHIANNVANSNGVGDANNPTGTGNGIRLDAATGGSISAQITGNTTNSNGTGFHVSINDNDTGQNTTFANLASIGRELGGNDGNGNGILINATTFNGLIDNNTANSNGTGGNIDGKTSANATTPAGSFGAGAAAATEAKAGIGNGCGILVNVPTFNGNITNNLLTGNGVGGSVLASAFADAKSTTIGNNNLTSGASTTNTYAAYNAAQYPTSVGSANAAAAVEATGGMGNGRGLWVNAVTINGNVTGNTANSNGKGGDANAIASASSSGVAGGSGDVAQAIAYAQTSGGEATMPFVLKRSPHVASAANHTATGGNGTGFGIFLGGVLNGTFSGNTTASNGVGGAATGSNILSVTAPGGSTSTASFQKLNQGTSTGGNTSP